MQQMGVGEEQAEELKVQHGEVILDQVAQAAPAATEPDAFLDFSLGGEDAGPSFDLSDDAPAAPASVTEPQFDVEPEAEPAAAAPVPAVAHDPQKLQVFAAMAPVLGELLTELRRSLEYFRGRTADGQIDEILICGGSARMPGLDAFLGSELGIPARVADPFAHSPVSAKSFSKEYLESTAPAFAVAVGLAARDMVSGPALASSGGKRGRK
jgi:hypothetical protein